MKSKIIYPFYLILFNFLIFYCFFINKTHLMHVQLPTISFENKRTTFYLRESIMYANSPFSTWFISVSAIFVILQQEMSSVSNFSLKTIC